MTKIYLFKFVKIFSCAFVLLLSTTTQAKTDVSLSDADISFSKAEIFEGDTIRIFARVNNLGDTDVLGFVTFLDNKKEIGGPQAISIKANTYDDVFIDWKPVNGNHNIEIKTIDLNLADENPENNKLYSKEFFIDKDTDRDGIGNEKDDDDDNDGLSDEVEKQNGTNPLNPDTDGDGANDKADAFPNSNKDLADTDNDGIGNNIDSDDDNDGLKDTEEILTYGTNPLSSDSDNDGLADKKEIELKTDPKKDDTDNDGTIDSKDDFPLDSAKGTANIFDKAQNLLKDKNLIYYISGGIGVFWLWLLVFRRKKRRRK